MSADTRNSLTRLAIVVLVGGVMFGVVGAARAQEQTRSDRQPRTAKQVRGVRPTERITLQALETPVVQLAMTFTRPVGLEVQGASTSSSRRSEGFVARPLNADRTEWGIFASEDGASAQIFDVIVFRDRVLIIAENDETTTGLLVSLDREAELVDAVAMDVDDVVASIVDYAMDLREVLEPTTESVAEFLDSLVVYANVTLAPAAGKLLPLLIESANPMSTDFSEGTVSVSSAAGCCTGAGGCEVYSGGCPVGTTPTTCPCQGSE